MEYLISIMLSQKNIWNYEYSKNANKWNKETINLPLILKNKKVLELGVGNGKTLKAILKQNPSETIAVDFSEKVIESVKNQFRDVEFYNADVKNLPFSDDEFDIVVCYYLLNNMIENDRKKAVKEIFRVLKKSGKVLFQDFAVEDYRQNGEFIEKNTILHKNGIICHFFTDKEMNSLFSKFNISNLKIEERFPIRKNRKIKRKIISGVFVK